VKESFADVAVDLPVEGLFTYAIPQTLESQVTLGKRVLVPFGKRTVTGYVTGVKKESDIEGVKDILDVLDDPWTAQQAIDRLKLLIRRLLQKGVIP